ncbi:unnamed protein product [Blepharisma stoltei]|uniref:Uncharacterized protein n=1 Tax=Blepharisma stoltei TaxID=1481888 RepID=A0AAU9JNM7_9CILI|nr:unnamed protein product [Blepharisma stoltei]
MEQPKKANRRILSHKASEVSKPSSRSHANSEFIPRYKEITPEEMGISFSKEKLLLSGIGSPDHYIITLESEQSLNLSITSRNKIPIRIIPDKISLSKKSRTADIMVFSDLNSNLEVEILHIRDETKESVTKKAFILGTQGIELRTNGSDEHYQLSHKNSSERFQLMLESALEGIEFAPKISQTLRPTPEVVMDNFEILCLKGDSDECYPDYPFWVDIAAGDLHGLACTEDGRLYSWGTGPFGQLGVPPETFVNLQKEIISVNVKKFWLNKLQDVKMLDTQPPNLKEYLEKDIIPYIPVSPKPIHVNFPSVVDAVACGCYHSMILSEGHVYTFGLGEGGRLGLGHENSVHTPTLVSLTKKCIKITAGYNTSFFLLENREVWSCGDHSQGANGHDGNILIPTIIPFIKNAHQISSAHTHSGIVTLDGTAILFGCNSDHKLGGESPHTYETVGGEKIRGVYCGGRHTCILTENLDVYAWGYNTSGQLGLSSTMFHTMTDPVKVEYLSGRGVVKLVLGWEHSIAITVDGLLYCWGSNMKGQLAIGTMAKEFKRVGLPRLIDHLLGCPVTSIAAGRYTSVFLTAESHPERQTNMFNHWKKALLCEERHMQELANYRFSLLIRDLKRDQLVKKVQSERDKEFSKAAISEREQASVFKPKKPRNNEKYPPESYYSFWDEECHNVETFEDRKVYKFPNPKYYKQERKHTVTVFNGPKKQKSERPKSSDNIDLRDIVAVASNEGAQLDPRLMVSNRDSLESPPERPVYYERIEYKPLYSYGPSLLYPNLFYPYDLVPNPMMLAPSNTK